MAIKAELFFNVEATNDTDAFQRAKDALGRAIGGQDGVQVETLSHGLLTPEPWAEVMLVCVDPMLY
jgi:hypothetical protein